MNQADLKSILAHMQTFNIPGFKQLLGDLKDPSFATRPQDKLKAIHHNMELLQDRLNAIQTFMGTQAAEVTDYMREKRHFSEGEWKALKKVRKDLTAYWEKVDGDLKNGNQIPIDENYETKKGEKKPRSPLAHKPKGGRKGWIAS